MIEFLLIFLCFIGILCGVIYISLMVAIRDELRGIKYALMGIQREAEKLTKGKNK